MQPTDELFLRFRRERDPDLLGQVYDQVAPGLLRAATHLVREPAAAEDLLQTTLLVALERADSFDPERGTLQAWLFGVLERQARNHKARESRVPDPERLEEKRGRRAELTPPERAAAEELERSLGRALEELPASFRPVLSLRLLHGLTPAEIAAALERPPGTVRSQLQRGLETLRRQLPTGFATTAGVLAMLGRPARGLEVLRAEFLHEASSLPILATASATSAVAVTTLTTTVLMKSLLAATVLVAAGALGWRLFSEEERAPLAREAPVVSVASVEEPTRAAPSLATREVREERTEVVAPAPVAERPVAPSTPAREPEPEAEVPVGQLLVRVLDPRGEAAPGCFVTADLKRSGQTFRDRVTCETDADGVARFEDVPAGHVYARLLRGSEDGTRVPVDGEAEIVLRLHEGIRVVGEVVDAFDRPIPEAEVWVSERWRPDTGHVVKRADRAGRFVLDHLTTDHFVGVRAEGLAPSHLLPVRGTPGEERAMRFALVDRAGVVTGRVVDQDGDPLAGASVLVGEEQNNGPDTVVSLASGLVVPSAPPQRLRTDVDGRFEAAFAPRGEVRVQARRRGFASASTTVLVGDAPADVELELRAGGTLRGRVLDEDGNGLMGILIRTDLGHAAFAQSTIYTKLDGRFEIRDLPPGTQAFVAVQERSRLQAREELDIVAGEVTTWEPRLVAGARIFGRVLDAAGQGVADCTVVARARAGSSEERVHSLRTDASGAFALAVEDDEERYTVWVHGTEGWQGFPRRIVQDVVASAQPLELVLGDGSYATGRLRGRVVAVDGVSVPVATVGVWHLERKIWREFAIDPGTGLFAIENVPVGPVSVEVRSEEHPTRHLDEVTVLDGLELDLGDISLTDSGVLVGDLVGAVEEELLSGLRFRLLSKEGGRPGGVERTGASFRSTPLAPGTHYLWVGGDFLVQRRVEFRVRSGEETYVSVDLQRAGRRRIEFEGVDGGDPPPSMWLQLVTPAGQEVWTDFGVMRTPAGVLFADVSAPPGVYLLRGGTPDGLVVQGEIDLVGFEGVQAPLRVRFLPAPR